METGTETEMRVSKTNNTNPYRHLGQAGKLHGTTTPNQAESMNAAVPDVRGSGNIGWALRRILEWAQQKHVEHATAAAAAAARMTPHAIVEHAELTFKATKLTRLVWVDEKAGTARVFPTSGPECFDVNIGSGASAPPAAACSCGIPNVNNKLCEHIALACVQRTTSAGNTSLAKLAFVQDTSARWKEQYTVAGDFLVPSLSDLQPTLEMPFQPALNIPRNRGRPKTKRGRGRSDAILATRKRLRAER